MTPDEEKESQARADAIVAKMNVPALKSFARFAVDERKFGRKVMWLRRIGDAIGEAARGIAPCHDGCSHCCHIPVLITAAEAEVIAHETGRELLHPEWCYEQKLEYIGNPCPFLEGDRCGIYEHRPLTCRAHYSVAADENPCRMDQPFRRVPYFNTTPLVMATLNAFGDRALEVADIREFFRRRSDG